MLGKHEARVYSSPGPAPRPLEPGHIFPNAYEFMPPPALASITPEIPFSLSVTAQTRSAGASPCEGEKSQPSFSY